MSVLDSGVSFLVIGVSFLVISSLECCVSGFEITSFKSESSSGCSHWGILICGFSILSEVPFRKGLTSGEDISLILSPNNDLRIDL